MSNEIKFKVGDKVEWLGVQGKVVGTHNGVLVKFDDCTEAVFYNSGRYRAGQNPSLKLISRAKKKIGLEYMIAVYMLDGEVVGESIVRRNRDKRYDNQILKFEGEYRSVVMLKLEDEFEIEVD